VIRFPDAPLYLLATFTKGFLGPIPNFEKGMEKTQDHRDLIAQRLPSIVSGWPAIGMNGFRGIIGIDSLGFAGQDARGFLYVILRGRLSNRCPQEAVFRRCGGDGNAFPLQPTVMFIGDEVLRSLLRVFDGRPDDTEAS
jgi:hypothetical protein